MVSNRSSSKEDEEKEGKKVTDKDTSTTKAVESTTAATTSPFKVVFVLGGPGAGKGTQCELLSKNLGWAHLSAGDLLRAERKKTDSELADLINSKIAAGQIVPASITVRLLREAMESIKSKSGNTKFLIDGFPRSDGNVTVWDEVMTDTGLAIVEFVLFLDCPEDVMTSRLLERGQTSGRVDDNLDVIRKRFETFRNESMPIVGRYEKKGKVRKVQADRTVEDIYNEVEALFAGL